MPTDKHPTNDSPRSFKRTGLASLLFAVARPWDASATALEGPALTLTMPFRRREIPMRDIVSVVLKGHWGWGGIRIRTVRGDTVVSGLRRRDAVELAAGLDDARIAWWQESLATHAPTLRATDARLAELATPQSYVRHRAFSSLVEDVRRATSLLPEWWPEALAAAPLVKSIGRMRAFLAEPDPEAVRARANRTFLEGELDRARRFLDRVEAQPLTDEQRRAVAVDDDRNLVVAAAGSGKTSVLVAKAGWVVERGDRRPEELLLLAFARDARDELAERVGECLGGQAGRDVNVQTFHSLGLSIIGEAEGRRPSVAKTATDNMALRDLLKGIIADLVGHREHGRALGRWLAYSAKPYRSEHEFRSRGEYYDYLRNQEIRSLQGELVKSFEECAIANFLYLNGVRYEYERPYEHDTATAKKSQYRPDFYLPDAGIYIEHFALSASGDTPPFIDRDEYTASRTWKLELHVAHGTTLIETFSHEQAAGRLTENLAEKLRPHGVKFARIPREKIFAALNEQGRVEQLTQLVATFLQHFKGGRLSIGELERRAAAKRDDGRSKAFLRVFRPIFERYEATLAEAGEIDFHDMINRATDHVSAGRYRSPYGYILVDEFQDISASRAALLKALVDQSPTAQLFAVGDDWQAIFRFAGSDIAVMREFEERFGAGARTYLETTFRCSEGLCKLATRFVLGNPAQIEKKVRTVHGVNGPAVWIDFGGDDAPASLDEALDRIAADAAPTEGRPSVLVLGRYRHLKPDMRRLARKHPALDLSYRTVHAAKGLEADYVVLRGVCAGRYGFPAEVADDPLLDLVLTAPEEHPNAEERRLFYVALTRAKRRACLLEEGGPRSPFVEELLQAGGGIQTFGSPNATGASCPECTKGYLVQRANESGGRFYGCSNYPYCEHTQSACPECGQGLPVRVGGTAICRECGHSVQGCPQCGGWLQPRAGQYGPFLGCSRWPACVFRQEPAVNFRGGGTRPALR